MRSKLVGPGPNGSLGAKSKFHDKIVGPGGKNPNKLRNILIGPGPKGRPHKRVDLEKVREVGREIGREFTEKKKQEKRLKVLEILNNILANKMEGEIK